MDQVLSAIEQSAFFTWVRESSSIWAYPSILFLHTVGMATVVGLSAMIDLRVLGFARQLPLDPLDRYFPFIWAGFWLNAISGVVLFAADATAKIANPVFAAKMLLVGGGTMTIAAIRRIVFGRGPDSTVTPLGKLLAAASLMFWLGATTTGRLMTYVK